MDGEWFRQQHRVSGVSQAELARRLGKSPTFLTRVYDGQQELKLSEAERIARIMGLPLPEVLARAGLSQQPGPLAPPAPRGLEESGAAPYLGDWQGMRPPQGGDQSVWTLRNDDLALAGYLRGDRVLVDMREQPRPGDVVLAQIYDFSADSATTVLRVWRPPYLVRPAIAADAPLLVDGSRVVIRGVVIAQSRERPA